MKNQQPNRHNTPTYEAQSELLETIVTKQGRRMLQSGLALKVQQATEKSQENLRRYGLARRQEIAKNIGEYMARGIGEIEQTLEPANYRASYSTDGLSERYTVTYGYNRPVTVGLATIKPDGSLKVTPSVGFNEADVMQVRDCGQELENMRETGVIPDLSDNLLSIEHA